MAGLSGMAGSFCAAAMNRPRGTKFGTNGAHATGLSVSGRAIAPVTAKVAGLFGGGYLADPGSPSRGAPV